MSNAKREEATVESSKKATVVQHIHELDKTTKVILGVAVGAVAIGVLGAALVPLKLKVVMPKLGLKLFSGGV